MIQPPTMMSALSSTELERLLAEDVPYGDFTTEALGIGACRGRASFAARNAMVVAAIEEAAALFNLVGADATLYARSGDRVEPFCPTPILPAPRALRLAAPEKRLVIEVKSVEEAGAAAVAGFERDPGGKVHDGDDRTPGVGCRVGVPPAGDRGSRRHQSGQRCGLHRGQEPMSSSHRGPTPRVPRTWRWRSWPSPDTASAFFHPSSRPERCERNASKRSDRDLPRPRPDSFGSLQGLSFRDDGCEAARGGSIHDVKERGARGAGPPRRLRCRCDTGANPGRTGRIVTRPGVDGRKPPRPTGGQR
jgi:quinolinate phosphoribosyl transferase-like protein